MKNLSNLIRTLVYHCARFGRQARAITATATVLVVGAVSSSTGTLIPHLEHFFHFLIYVIGSAVVLNILLRHGNELLEHLLSVERTTEHETRRMLTLLRELLGFPPKE
jgi:hypothetical protein